MDWVAAMEKKRGVRNAELKKKQDAEDAAKRAAALEASMSDEQKRKMEAAKHMSRTSVCVKQFTLPDPFVKINTDTTNDAEIWWNSTLNKRQPADRVLWTPRMEGEVPEEIAGLVEAYNGKTVLRGYRGLTDDFPTEEEGKSYEQVMIDFREHERVKRGRTTEVKGTESQRPSQQHDPMGSMRWLNKVTQIPAGLVKQSAAEKVKSLCTLADMSEELSVEEAAEIVELGAVNPLIDLVNEAEDEHKDRGIHQYLHGTKEGTAEEQDKWVWQVHVQAARSLRNLLCILSTDFSMQDKAGSGKRGSIAYGWLPRQSATFVDVILTMPGMYEMLFRLLVHENHVTQEHATHALLHTIFYSRGNRELLLSTGGLLDLLCSRIISKIPHLQEVSIELLLGLMHSNEARKKILLFKFKGPDGQETGVISACSRALSFGTERSRGFAARVVWELCAKDGSQRHYRSILDAKRGNGGNRKGKTGKSGKAILTQSDVEVILGEGIEVDLVKQDVCREPGLLEGLVSVMRTCKGAGLESACGAIWCLSLERNNKRRIGLFDGVVQALVASLNSGDSTDNAKRLASNSLRNLATDMKTMDHMTSLDKNILEQLIMVVDINKWQQGVVSQQTAA